MSPSAMGLPVHQAPNLPFSSPILEEIPSPTSSAEERDAERNRPFKFLSKNTSRNPFIHESEYSSNARRGQRADGIDTARRIGGQERKNDPTSNSTIQKGPEKPFGLNLVTDFSRPHPNNHNNAPVPAFVDLNDLKTLSKEREKERSTQKVRDVFRKRPLHRFHHLPEEPSVAEEGHVYLDTQDQPSPGKKGHDELSPSDRPIMIGYTVPADEVSASQQDKAKGLDSAESQPTPSIVITPAKEDTFWSMPSPDYRRPRSSVYSQPTPRIGQSPSDIPPVPAIPALHSVAKNRNASSSLRKRQSALSTRNRSLSTGTVFEEDASPQLVRRSRSYSEDTVKTAHAQASQLQSETSFVNKHQSQGWWTYLLSPLLSRSSTVASKKTPTSAEAPPIPSVSTTSTEWWEDKEVSSFSPDTPTPERAVARRGIDGCRGSDNLPDKDTSDRGRELSAEYGVMSPMFPGKLVQGAAAEYYQACAHELFSGRPYFECINHVCSITPKDKINIAEDDATAQATGGSKGLALLDVDEPNETKDPFAESSHARHFSETTLIEDTTENPFDTDKAVKAPREVTKAFPENDSPIRDRALPEMQPMPLYPSEEQKSSLAQQSQRAAAAPSFHIQFPSNTCQTQTLGEPEEGGPRRITVFPGSQENVQSPDTPSPGLRQATERSGSIPLSDVHGSPAPPYGSNDNGYPLPPRPGLYPISRGERANSIGERYRIEARRQRLEREDQLGQRAGGLWRGRGPVSKRGCFGRPGPEGRLRRRWYMAIAAFFLTIVVVVVALATTLTRKGDETPVQSRWLNLTGYPPMPTGIATVAGPEPQVQNSGCIKPSSMWSCALPKEQQKANKPYSANQPNFRVSILFRNGTYGNSTVPVSSSAKLRARGLFEPSPPPPSIEDQTFLGHTTDQNSKPYAGEETPFYITLLSPIKLPSPRLGRRSSFPDLSSLIPPPDDAPDGTAAAANLYPLPDCQPIRLYNRGQSDEHYGFYTYFDRSIFLNSSDPLDGGQVDNNPDDRNGGASEAEARVRCTWAQTRFLVQIWTQPTRAGMALLDDSPFPSSTAQSTPTPSLTPTSTPTPVSSSATDFTRPGSFPYPITITVDRHGGAAREKMVYCYGLDNEQHINSTEKKLQIEDRGFGGTLVNPAPGIFNNTNAAASGLIGRGNANIGPVDGGTGGCSCQWANWVSQA